MSRELVNKPINLPSNLEDLTKFVLVGREKLVSVRAEMRAIDKLDLATEVKDQKREEASMLAGALLDAEAKIGELLNAHVKAGSHERKIPDEITRAQSSQFQALAANKDIIEKVKAEAKDNDDLPTRTEVLRKIKELGRMPQTEFLDYLRYFNMWNFHMCDKLLGIKHPGQIPGQIIRNLLYYYPSEVLVDPFGGGGSTYDAWVKAEKKDPKKLFIYDLAPRRKEIKQHDITTGFPDECKDADFIFLDPPYWDMKKEEYVDNSVASLTLEQFYRFIKKLAEDCLKTVKVGGYVAIIISPRYYEDPFVFIDLPIHCNNLFMEAGFLEEIRIQVPYTTQQYDAHTIIRGQNGKFMHNIIRDLIVYKKVGDK